MEEHENLKKEVEFKKYPPPPIPGPFFMDMIPNIDTTVHSSSLDQNYKTIHTPILELFPVDILSELRALEEDDDVSWLKKETIIGSNYYQEKIDRNELLMRDEQKKSIQDVLDYQAYLDNTFNLIHQDLQGYEIAEEYPLVPDDSKFAIVTGDINNNNNVQSCVLEASETSLIDKCTVNKIEYNSTKVHVEDKICIEIKNGKAYFSDIKYAYKFKRSDSLDR